MGEGEDHIVLPKNMKAQQLDQVLALFERGIEHDDARSLVRKTKTSPRKFTTTAASCMALACSSSIKSVAVAGTLPLPCSPLAISRSRSSGNRVASSRRLWG